LKLASQVEKIMINSRRNFLKQILAGGALLSVSNPEIIAKHASGLLKCKTQALTRGPRHHFFGYYGICPWNRSGQYLLSLESSFHDRFPTQDESAAIGLVDANNGQFEKISENHAWNLQQGAMLHWNPLHDDEILYNDRQGNQIISMVRISRPARNESCRPLLTA